MRSAILAAACLAAGAAAQGSVTIEILGASPRTVATSTSGVFDEVSSGLRTVGIGQKMYFQATVSAGITVVGYLWRITQRPAGSTADLSSTSDPLVTFRPDVAGVYVITVGVQEAGAAGESDEQTIYATTFAGTGLLDTHEPPAPRAPECGTGFCHGGNNADPRLFIAAEWLKSKHAQKLQLHMNGAFGSHYAVSCLECHTLGFNANLLAVNGGFDDVAAAIGYDLNQIPVLVQQASDFHVDNFPLLPAALQNKASIECESCHGAGSLHPSRLQDAGHGIDGVDLGLKQCAQCHDSASGFQQKFYQWNSSSHPLTTQAGEGDVARTSSCLKCHTGEGFVGVQIDGESPTVIPNPNPVTCSTCHDPHFSDFLHQLRAASPFTMDSGQTFSAGLGGLCAHCHNSRVADPGVKINTSFRGAHHGPQADMFLGVNGASFNLPFSPNSAHYAVVEDLCVHCHMATAPVSGPGIIEPPAVGEHSFAVAADTPQGEVINVANACQSCHAGLTDYDRPAGADYDGDGAVEGIQTEVTGLFDRLTTGILTTMPGTSVDTEEAGRIAIGSADFANLTANQKAALYNYNFVSEDRSFGVHNASYAVQLLQRSYFGVHGRPINQDFPLIALRGPADPSTLPEGAPVLLSAADNGNGSIHLTWDMTGAAPPAQFLGLAFDIYTSAFVNKAPGNSIWYPFPFYATSGDIPLGLTGGYHAWISSQYGGGGFFPTANPFTGIVYSGTPHTPLNVSAQKAGGLKAMLHWTPDIFGTAAYLIVAFSVNGGDFVVTQGPSGASLFQTVPFGGTDFANGAVTLTLPQAGQYQLFVAGTAWDFNTVGEFASAPVAVP